MAFALPWPVLSATPNALSMAVNFRCGELLLSSRKFTQPMTRTTAQAHTSGLPLVSGEGRFRASAIVRVIGRVNFLDDSSQTPHLSLTEIDQAFGVAESTGQGKAKAIRDLLKIRQFDFHWMLRQRVEESPMAWMIEVNGFVVDARRLKREIQEEAYRKGLIPYLPGEKAAAEDSQAE